MRLDNYDEEDTSILDELEQYRQKKKNIGSVLNKKKINKYEMDDFFMGG